MQQGKQQPQHQPAVDPAFWNITRNSKLGEFESGMTQMLFNQALDYHKQNQSLKNRIKRLEQSAQEIDNEWFQVIESILGFHPVSMTEALRIGIERIKKQNQRIKRLEEAGDEAICPLEYAARVRIWTKAKESK
jgi:hypothetical protein